MCGKKAMEFAVSVSAHEKTYGEALLVSKCSACGAIISFCKGRACEFKNGELVPLVFHPVTKSLLDTMIERGTIKGRERRGK